MHDEESLDRDYDDGHDREPVPGKVEWVEGPRMLRCLLPRVQRRWEQAQKRYFRKNFADPAKIAADAPVDGDVVQLQDQRINGTDVLVMQDPDSEDDKAEEEEKEEEDNDEDEEEDVHEDSDSVEYNTLKRTAPHSQRITPAERTASSSRPSSPMSIAEGEAEHSDGPKPKAVTMDWKRAGEDSLQSIAGQDRMQDRVEGEDNDKEVDGQGGSSSDSDSQQDANNDQPVVRCSSRGHGRHVAAAEAWKLELQLSLNDQLWRACRAGDVAEATRLLGLGAEINLHVWVRESDNAVLYAVADEEEWGATPLDRLVKFGLGPEISMAAEVLCAVHATGKQQEHPAQPASPAAASQWVPACSRALRLLKAHPSVWPFLQPVDPSEAPGYLDEITYPMDLGTVSRKLQQREYSDPAGFVRDVRLVFANALHYNGEQDLVYKLATQLSVVFTQAIDKEPSLRESLESQHSNADAPIVAVPPVRVAEGWHVPPPLNFTLLHQERKAQRDQRRSAACDRPRPARVQAFKSTAPSPHRHSPGSSKPPPSPLAKPPASPSSALSRGRRFDWRRECARVLLRLWRHKHVWPFAEPVDPVALEIPTYFDVVKRPMDLGTVKQKLQNETYTSPDKFADDVRLTFSNAMLFNPKGNYAHDMASELNELFAKSWAELKTRIDLHWQEEHLTASLEALDI